MFIYFPIKENNGPRRGTPPNKDSFIPTDPIAIIMAAKGRTKVAANNIDLAKNCSLLNKALFIFIPNLLSA
ncbi:hypothetical protein D3C84_1253530 [compost metagenome]